MNRSIRIRHALQQRQVVQAVAQMVTVAVLGAGTLGNAIIGGVLESQSEGSSTQSTAFDTPSSSVILDPSAASAPSKFIACVSRDESARKLRKTYANEARVEVRVRENVQAVQEADVVLLGCKPQKAQTILGEPGLHDAIEGKLLISILGGTTSAQLRQWLPASTRVVRCMPNVAAKVRTVSRAA